MLPLIAQIEFEFPGRLFWLLVFFVVAYFAWWSRASAPRGRRWLSFACRIIILTLVVLAFTGLSYRQSVKRLRVVFVRDMSRSIQGDAATVASRFIAESLTHQRDNEAAIVQFAGECSGVTPLLPTADDVSEAPGVPPFDLNFNASDPSAAVATAAASGSDQAATHIVLLTDGIETNGSLLETAARLDTPVSIVPLPAFALPEVGIEAILAPDVVSTQSAAAIDVLVLTNQPMEIQVELLANDRSVAIEDVSAGEGETVVRFNATLEPYRDTALEARVISATDTQPENNRRRANLYARPQNRVMLVESQDGSDSALVETLRQQGMQVAVQQEQGLTELVGTLGSYDLLILSGIAPDTIDVETSEAIDDFVAKQGGGLIVAGGDRTFGEATYRGSALESILPVEAMEAVESERSTLAMVLVIDRSSSMNKEQRMELAKQAAQQSVNILEPHDKAGVLVFSDEPEWISEIVSLSDRQSLLDKIDTIQPGGQTHMFPAVERRELLALEQTDADRRQMMLLTDGVPSPGDYGPIARRIAEAGITLVTISISQEAEQDLLKKMAELAGGRHVACIDPEDITEILVRETRTAVSQAEPREFQPFVLRALPGLDIGSAPSLQGYVPTNPKAETEPLLIASEGDPLLCWGRYGQGVTVALTTDMQGDRSQPWQTWNDYGAFWQRLVRQAVRAPAVPTATLKCRRCGESVTITVDMISPEQQWIDDVQLQCQLTRPDKSQVSIPLVQTAAGRYESSFNIRGEGEYRIEAAWGSDEHREAPLKQSIFVDYPDELRIASTNEQLLRGVAERTGGVYQPDPATLFTSDTRLVDQQTPLWFYLLLAATLLWVGDIALRRLKR